MARAAQLIFDETDYTLAKKYFAAKAKGALGVTLEVVDGIVTNPTSKATFNVAVSPARKDNCMTLLLDGNGNIPFGKPDAGWLALIELETSDCHMIDWFQLHKYIAWVVEQGGRHQGMRVEKNDNWWVVSINHGWAESQKMVHRCKCLGKGKDAFSHVRGIERRTTEQFCHLHVHSYYSMLDGVASPEDLARTAALTGQPGIALTDHGVMYGLYKFWKACKDYSIKSVLGVEGYLVDDVNTHYKDIRNNSRRFEHHITLHAMNQQGWENLCEMMSIAGRDHYYYVPRIDFKLMERFAEGIICLTGCFKGPGQHYLQEFDPMQTADTPWYCFNPDRALAYYKFLQRIYPGRLYGEIQNISFDRYMKAVPKILQMYKDLGIPEVVTQDVHYLSAEDAKIQWLMKRITGIAKDDPNAPERDVYYIRSREEMQHPLFEQSWFDRSCEIMERCTVDLGNKGYLFPEYDVARDQDYMAFQQQLQEQTKG
jgi:hypothetical protein